MAQVDALPPSPPQRPEPRPPSERHEGFHVLRLSGSDYEMGFQHGTLLREAIARGPLPSFSRYVEKLLGVGTLGPAGVLGARALGEALSGTVGRAIAGKFPRFAREGLEGMADGAGIGRRDLMKAVTMPETYLWVVSRYMALRGFHVAPRLLVPTMGCTSAIAWGEATSHGDLLHGRNFDYQAVGSWDREPVIAFYRPRDGQEYVSVSAAGVLFGGITAMNASGLSLVVHQHLCSSEFDLGGTPVGVVGDQIMRHARTLDDARRLLDEHVPNGAWTYVIGSAAERSVLCYELTSRRRAIVAPEGDTFAYSNIFLSPDLEGIELYVYPSQWRHNAARFRRATAMLAEARGGIDEEQVASILGDLGEGGCRLSTAISTLQTVASVVFRPAQGIVWAGAGRAPTSNRPFVAFDLRGERARPDLGRLEAGARVEPRAAEAFEAYRDAYERHFYGDDLPQARALVEKARELQPGEPAYHFVAGLLALEAGEPAEAEQRLDRAIALGHPHQERLASFFLWRARARDARGRRGLALRDYREALLGDPAVREAARKGLSRPWRPGRTGLEWTFGDVAAP